MSQLRKMAVHLSVKPGVEHVKRLAERSPAELLIKTDGRKSRVAPQLGGISGSDQLSVGKLEQLGAESPAAKPVIDRHPAQLPRWLAEPVIADERRSSQWSSHLILCRKMHGRGVAVFGVLSSVGGQAAL